MVQCYHHIILRSGKWGSFYMHLNKNMLLIINTVKLVVKCSDLYANTNIIHQGFFFFFTMFSVAILISVVIDT